MAKATLKMPEDFLLKISALGNKTDEIVPRVLEVGGDVVLKRAKVNLSAAVGKNTKRKSRSTGELSWSLGLSKPRQNRSGDWDVKVGFAEPRSGGESNAKIANILEYGRHGHPARPFLKPAKSQSKGEAIEAMKAKFQQEVDGV